MPLGDRARWKVDIVFCNVNTSRNEEENIFNGIVETKISLKSINEGCTR